MHRAILAMILLLAGAGAGSGQTPPSPAEEAALVSAWKVHLAATNDHPKVVSACQEFRKKSPASQFGVVADGLAAWHLLQANEPAAATNLLEKMLGLGQTDQIGKAGMTMARRWLTRLDRERVKLALKQLYRKDIEFPPSLEAMRGLPAAQRGPFTDRWGQTWSYRLTEFKSPNLKNLRGQRYELQSAMLRADSDLAEALKRPYAAKINLKAVKLISASPGKEAVEFVTTDEKQQKTVLTVGTDVGGVTFLFLGSGLLILSDGDSWAVLPKAK